MEVLKYYLKPSEGKIIATLIIFCVYLVYATFVLSMNENILGFILLFFLYLVGGPGAFLYMWTNNNTTEFVSIVLVLLAIYQYLLTCLFQYIKDRFSSKEEVIKPRSFNF